MTNTIRLLIACDSPIATIGIETAIKDNDNFCIVQICKDFTTTVEAIKRINDLGIVIISFLAEEDDIRLSSYISAINPDIKKIILTSSRSITHIIASIQTNITAYIINDISIAEFIDTLANANHGHGLYYGGSIPIDKLMLAFGNNKNITSCKPYELTIKEQQVLKLIAKGCCSKEIAEVLNIRSNTVETYKERIKRKLGVSTIMEAVVFGVERKFI